MPSVQARIGGAHQPDVAAAPLSVIHADALYRPRPPVAYDDDGYPFEDRKLSESSEHDDALSYFREVAVALMAEVADACVQRNLLILFEEGNPRAAVEPDVLVSLRVGRRARNSYKLWLEGKPPDFALEGLSEKTWRRDLEVKPALYRDLGIGEYWRIDPLGRAAEAIAGFRLVGGVYEPIGAERSGWYRSAVLNAELYYDRVEAQARDLHTGMIIPPLSESLRLAALARRDAEQSRRDAERARYDAERARYDAERARHDMERARDQAERAARRGEQSERKRNEERRARLAAEERIAELEALLGH